jgi:cell division septal protein FtsQ
MRRLLAHVPRAAKVVLVVAAAVMVFVGYRTASSASFFQVRRVDVSGTSRTSPEEVANIVRRAAGRTGVWRADLPGISSELERLPGIKTAVITRVLPDGLRVRISERVPAGVVRTSAGHFVWMDQDAVTLRDMAPTDQIPPFFIRGWNEDETAEARAENVERMQKYLELTRDWNAAGLADRVSEVNLIDIRDIRAQLSGNDSQIEVRLGGQDPGIRLKNALKTLDEYRSLSQGGLITYVDITQGVRAILGFATGAQISAAGGTGDEAKVAEVTEPAVLANKRVKISATATTNANTSAKPVVKPVTDRDGNKTKSRDEAKALTRSRRTG